MVWGEQCVREGNGDSEGNDGRALTEGNGEVARGREDDGDGGERAREAGDGKGQRWRW